jgi:hypothetical protein
LLSWKNGEKKVKIKALTRRPSASKADEASHFWKTAAAAAAACTSWTTTFKVTKKKNPAEKKNQTPKKSDNKTLLANI